MAETKRGRRSWIPKAIWLGGGVIVFAMIVLSITFAAIYKNGNSGPGDVRPGDIQPQSDVLVSDNCGSTNDEGSLEPPTIQLTCGDGTIVAGNLIWSQWGSTTAMGQGSVNEVSCVPDCADGKDVAYKAGLMLSEPVKAESGKEYFTRIKVTFIGSGPDGSSSQLFKDCSYTSPAPYIPQCPAGKRGAN